MGVEVVGFEAAQVPVEAVAGMDNSFLHEKENGKLNKEPEVNEPIQFGSHEEVPVNGEGKDAADANLPKDAVDEWPAPQKIHSFYIVRYHQYDDPSIKAKIDQADKEVQKRNLSHNRISEEIYAKKATRQELRNQLRTLRTENGQFRSVLDEKRTKIAPLQQALGKMRNPNNAGRSGLCSSEEELNDVIYSLNYRIQHESIPLSEEKQILKEIRQLEGTREKVIANADERTKLQESFGQKEAIQDQVKLMGSDLDGVRKEQQAVWAKILQLDEKVKALNAEIESLEDQRQAEIEKRNKAYESIREQRRKRDEGNANFFQSRKLLTEARELAAKKDVKALEEFSLAEGDKFISSWCNNKSFRDDYEKRLLQSLDRRQLSRDGRIRNPDEKPLVTYGSSVPADHPQPAVKAAAVKRPKEEPKPAQQKDAPPAPKAQKEIKAENKTQSKNLEHDDIVDREIFVPEKVEKNLPSAEEVVDPAKLKELKREEEIAKAKQAMERKRKLAEKAAAKAAIRAEKEAEKKLKDREKKLKKKAAATTTSTDPEEPSETVAEVEEAEKVEASDEAAVPLKEKSKRDNNQVKHRIRPRGGKDAHPKVLLKRKKSNNYWLWAAAPAAVLVLMLLALGYYYYLI